MLWLDLQSSQQDIPGQLQMHEQSQIDSRRSSDKCSSKFFFQNEIRKFGKCRARGKNIRLDDKIVIIIDIGNCQIGPKNEFLMTAPSKPVKVSSLSSFKTRLKSQLLLFCQTLDYWLETILGLVALSPSWDTLGLFQMYQKFKRAELVHVSPTKLIRRLIEIEGFE